jgi:hypothetical protein
MNAVSTARVDDANPFAAPDVLGERHRIKVPGIDARPVPTKMVERKAVGDRAKVMLIDDTMGEPVMSADPRTTIAALVPRSSPGPTAISLAHDLSGLG